jgi:hypothetical protein
MQPAMSRSTFATSIATSFAIFVIVLTGWAAALPAYGQATGSYARDLSAVYRAYQQLLSVREACHAGAPAQQPAIDRAYDVWKKRHGKFVEELDTRLNAMIRAASSDPQEYSRNVGKYEGELLRQRTESRERFLAQEKSEIERLCRQFPSFLRGKESDLEHAYAEEMESVRRLRP